MRISRVSQAVTFAMMLAASTVPAWGGAVAPNLATSASFGMLGSTISNTGVSLVAGDVGATTTVTGFPPGLATGTVFAAGDPVAMTAYADFLSAFNPAFSAAATQTSAGLTTDQTFLGNNVYAFLPTDVTSVANTNVTFDAQGNSGEVFILRVNRDLTVNGLLNFNLINGALASNIYWIIGGSATISPNGNPEVWDGDILAGGSFTMSANTGGSGVLAGTINGCVFAETANTLAGQTNVNGCGATVATPEPGSLALVIAFCLMTLTYRLRKPVCARLDRIRSDGGQTSVSRRFANRAQCLRPLRSSGQSY